MCTVTVRGRISLASVPTISKQSRDSRESGNARSHSPHHTWNDIAGLTLNSSTCIQWLCVNTGSVDVLVTSVWAAAFFAEHLWIKRDPPLPRSAIKGQCLLSDPCFLSAACPAAFHTNEYSHHHWAFSSQLLLFWHFYLFVVARFC